LSYREENGQVVLSMPVQEYEHLMICLGIATAVMERLGIPVGGMLRVINRLNEGKPDYIPYAVQSSKR
jgi:hypothetical protein